MAQLLIACLIVYFSYWISPSIAAFIQNITKQLKQKLRIRKKEVLFDSNYIEVKTFYVREFNATPCISFINNLDTAKAFDYINKGNAGKVLGVYQRTYFSWQQNQQEFSYTVFKLANKVMIELGHDYAEILFGNSNYGYSKDLMQVFSTMKAAEKEEDFEINVITQNSNGLDLKQLDIKPTVLDIDLYYNDDFKPVDEVIRARLEKENDKGIILLHGLPGTGKTTYLRHLIGSIKKKVLFVSPGVAGNLMNPEFIDLLIDNPNAVVVIEDAENIIMDRKYSPNSSVSNLLNISDGLLSDCLNVQIICTFNSDLNTVDSALMRKGRLIAKYEFGKLDAAKAQKLSDQLGFKNVINKPMTLAEITNPGDMDVVKPAVQVLGFRREQFMN
jgi:ATPase family associated with various cellular activities (AAA)